MEPAEVPATPSSGTFASLATTTTMQYRLDSPKGWHQKRLDRLHKLRPPMRATVVVRFMFRLVALWD